MPSTNRKREGRGVRIVRDDERKANKGRGKGAGARKRWENKVVDMGAHNIKGKLTYGESDRREACGE